MSSYDSNKLTEIGTAISELRSLCTEINNEIDDAIVGTTDSNTIEKKLKLKDTNFYINSLDDFRAGGQGNLDRTFSTEKESLKSNAKNW